MQQYFGDSQSLKIEKEGELERNQQRAIILQYQPRSFYINWYRQYVHAVHSKMQCGTHSYSSLLNINHNSLPPAYVIRKKYRPVAVVPVHDSQADGGEEKAGSEPDQVDVIHFIKRDFDFVRIRGSFGSRYLCHVKTL